MDSPRAYFDLLNVRLSEMRQATANAVIWLQGDRYDRAEVTLQEYKQKRVPRVVITGNNQLIGTGPRPGEDNVSLEAMEDWLLKYGVLQEDIVIDANALNTRDQALNICLMANRRNWQSFIITGSFPYYMARPFLTFLQARKETKWKGDIRMVGASLNPSDPSCIPGGRDKSVRALLDEEFGKIIAYQAKDHLVSFEEGLAELLKE